MSEPIRIPIQNERPDDSDVLIAAGDLEKRLASNSKLHLIDVRSEVEFRMMHIDGARLATRELVEDIFSNWPKDASIVVYDHFGKDALGAAKSLKNRGFADAKALAGGIDAWSKVVDPLLPQYP